MPLAITFHNLLTSRQSEMLDHSPACRSGLDNIGQLVKFSVLFSRPRNVSLGACVILWLILVVNSKSKFLVGSS